MGSCSAKKAHKSSPQKTQSTLHTDHAPFIQGNNEQQMISGAPSALGETLVLKSQPKIRKHSKADSLQMESNISQSRNIKYGCAIQKGKVTKYYCTVENKPGSVSRRGVVNLQHNLTGMFRAGRIVPKNGEDRLIEYLTLNEFNHPNLIGIIEIYEDDKQHIVVEEALQGPLLKDYLKSSQKISERQLNLLMRQIVQAVFYLHKSGLVHGRLSLSSFQLFDRSPGDPYIKLIDYDQAFMRAEVTIEQMHFLAPENVSRANSNQAGDIWACGMMAYQLITGQSPYTKADSVQAVKHAIQKGGLAFDTFEFDRLGEGCKSVLKLMLSVLSKRISMENLISHDFFRHNLPSKQYFDQALNSLLYSKQLTKLESRLLIFMIQHLCQKQQQIIYDIFSEIDVNKDAALSSCEIQHTFLKIFGNQLSKAQVKTIIQQIDVDQNGSVDFSEFMCAIINKKELLTVKNLEATFYLMDLNHNGRVNAKELSELLKIDKEEVVKDMQTLLDATKTKKYYLELETFKEMMLKLIK